MLPSELTIQGLDFSVAEVELVSRDTMADGEIDCTEQTIRIYSGLSQQKKEQTLFHELIHGCLAQLQYTDEYEDEKLVQGLAVSLHQALAPFTSFCEEFEIGRFQQRS